MLIDINVQQVMNESAARGEDDLRKGKAEVMCFYTAFGGVDVDRCLDCEFQMTEAAERSEREPKLVVDGVGTRKFLSED